MRHTNNDSIICRPPWSAAKQSPRSGVSFPNVIPFYSAGV